MAQPGLCVNAKDAVPDRAECAALGVGPGIWVRTHIDGSLTLLDGMLAKLPPDVPILLTLNNQCREVEGDWSGWGNVCRIIATRYANRVKIVGCGNELDSYYYDGDGSVSPAFAANLVNLAAPILRPAGIKVAMSSVASGNWGNYLADMTGRCWENADYADLHPYVKEINGVPAGAGWPAASAAIIAAAHLSGHPVICSEAGIKVDDAGGLEAQAQWVAGLADLPAELVCSWCWHDRMASPGELGGQAFGAIGLDGKRKPSWYALQGLFREAKPQPQALGFVQGFKEIADRHPDIVGQPREQESGPWRNCSAQFTTKGLLLWGNFIGSGDEKGFIANDLTRYVWDGRQLRKVA